MPTQNRKAYSYIRFSTPEQSRGDSQRRQIEESKKYAEQRGLILDETTTLVDHGRSAFTGKNIAVGELGLFIQRVEAGEIPSDSVLIVENIDRISREEFTSAIAVLLRIIEAGIEIVTLSNPTQPLTKKTINENQFLVHGTMMSMLLAHEESKKKSKRIAQAWEQKRNQAREKHNVFTKRLPGWLSYDHDTGAIVVDSERAKVVTDIYDWALRGLGAYRITRKLNENHTPTFGKSAAWSRSTVKKILRNKSVYGQFQPYRSPRDSKRKPDGPPVEDYFPQIVSKSKFDQTQAAISSRKLKGGRIGRKSRNIFTHIAQCGHCGNSMVYANKGKWHYLVCSHAKRKIGCTYASWPYVDFETRFLEFVEELDYSRICGDSKTPQEIRDLESTIEDKKIDLSQLIEAESKLIHLYEKAGASESETITKRIISLQTQQADLENEVRSSEKILKEKQSAYLSLTQPKENILTMINNRDDIDFRNGLINEIRKQISSIRIFSHVKANEYTHMENTLSAMNKDDDWPSLEEVALGIPKGTRAFLVTFKNGSARLITIDGDGYTRVMGEPLPSSRNLV